MAKGKPKCDVCRKECDVIVGKLFYTPLSNGRRAHVHSKYSHHADVGNCCGEPKNDQAPAIMRLIRWTKRVPAKVYRSRGKRGVSSVPEAGRQVA